MKPQKVKLKTIAEDLGLGYTTVAQILQGKTNYRASTIARVKHACEQQGYRPDYLSKALKGGQSMSIGFLLSSLDTPIESEVALPIENAAREHGYMVYLSAPNSHDQRMIDIINDFIQRRVDGIIFYNTLPYPQALQEYLAQITVPIVVIRHPASEALPAMVSFDGAKAYTELAETLYATGHREIAYLTSELAQPFSPDKSRQLAETIEPYGIKICNDPAWRISQLQSPGKDAYGFIQHYLHSGKSLPDAILCNNDFIALGAIAAILDNGLKVPDDVSVIGHDDYQTSALVRPRLSTISTPSRELIGRSAFDLLLQMIQNRNAKPEPIVLEREFIKGETIGKRNRHDK